ncbi:hypothetical protein DYB25_008429 [Aphanomyces astaci]|uniref:Peptidase S9 prolyl oligopeptidase catalytic domain-containing protein n=2 Tax=Aphanomyces astaci TaxID=112090 RepID=A0A397EM84_APHAT|nr:hypothetical protein DYB25_008429 [Aphanomyces astaci]RHY97356.1 hypothetical protein DYB31_003286 [Aphanomyces astaci]
MTTPVAAIVDLQERLAKLAPKLALQPMPKIAVAKGKHGTKTSSALRGVDLLLALCATDDQREQVVELVEKYNPSEMELALTGALDAKTNKFNLTKAVFLTDDQLVVHRFVELIELQLEDPESAAGSVALLLTENGHSAADTHVAEECLTIAYALQTLLRYGYRLFDRYINLMVGSFRAFPSIPLAIQGLAVEIDDATNIVDVFGPLFFAPKKAKKSDKKHTMEAAHTPKKRKNRVGAKYTLLFSHGNAEDLGMVYDWFREVSRRINVRRHIIVVQSTDVHILQVNVMAYDYTGYGISLGIPSEEAVYSDIEAAFAYLVNVKKTRPEHILLYGRSLGTGPSCYLAAKQSRLQAPVGGVVLQVCASHHTRLVPLSHACSPSQSPLLSIYRVAFQFRFSLLGDMFCNIDHVGHIESPVTIIHGTRDEVIPFWHGEELFVACQAAWRSLPLWVQDAGHNNIEAFLGYDSPPPFMGCSW